MNDEFYIKRTLKLARKALGMTNPNPMVGAVLIKNGHLIAEDFHKSPGTPHAEALVIKKAGEKTRGSTLYVNLEPCCHTDKRTPPCTKAIITAGIKNVVIGMVDPNPKVAGRGIAELQNAGIKVSSGILVKQAKKCNEVYIKYIITGKPFVVLKVAMSLDGKIATPEGQSKWITGEQSRKVVHRLRGSVDAIITAIGTVKADDPQLTARIKGANSPRRVVIDPNLEIPLSAKILKTPPETIIVTKTMNNKINYIEKSGCKVIYFKQKLDIMWLLEILKNLGIFSLLIEGGASLNSHALEDGIVDKVMFFIAPIIIGGQDAYPAVGGKTYRKLEEAYRIKNSTVKRIGDDLLIEGYINEY
jgi:diaminohydroxyphosphoribosylaminopyrimidine deaminase/5-amino-6-(5-phosphoribosylamino)uracil reductase